MRQTDLDKSPYFDDFKQAKRFHQVLFKAGQTVQSRELNEIQDIAMTQLEAIGSHLFKNGSVVIPGNFVVQTKLTTLQVIVPTPVVLNVDDLRVRGVTSGVEAKVKLVSQSGSSSFCFCEIIKSGNNGVTKSFTALEQLVFYTVDSASVETVLVNSSLISTGLGSYAQVDEGVYFVRGMMVRCESQSIILSNTVDISKNIGFEILEEIITAEDDPELNSNALGEPNYRSPGADRLRLTITLATRDIGVEDPNFLSLATVVNGNVERLLSEVQYNELEKVLAQRTYEESGNYSVASPKFEIREHLNDGTNGGVYTLAEGGDENKLVVVVSPAVHYVFGYRVENSVPKFVDIPKSRDTVVANNAATAALYGSLIDLNSCTGTPIIDTNVLYTIRDVGDAQIGTFRTVSATKQGTNMARLVARDIKFISGKSWVDAAAVRATKAAASFRGVLVTKGILGGGDPSLILQLPYSGVKSLQSTGITDTTYPVTSDFSVILNASGVGVVTAPSGSTFLGTFSQFVTCTENGATGEIPVSYSLVGSPVGSGIQIDAGVGYANQTLKSMLIAQKATAAPRTKKLTIAIDTITVNPTDRTYQLTNADIVGIRLVTRGSTDLTAQFSLDNGRTDFSYERGSITSSQPLTAGTITVEYEYFAHGPGDYFCVDSYLDVDYNDIPSYTDSSGNVFDLRDCLDFRKTNTAGTYNASYIASPSNSVLADIEYYLPRFNSLYVNSEGEFGNVVGVSSQSPDVPKVPVNAMKLTDLFLPSWTFSVDTVLQFPVNNRRYTMRDIGSIDQRLENVEYYTALSLLEADANNIQVIDPTTGNDRFKNGIIADQFIDFRLMNPEDPECFASIDDAAGRLRPLVDSVGLTATRVSGGKVLDEMVSATTNAPIVFLMQPFATKSINVNPYAVFSWAGFVNLSPSRDFWVDTVYTQNKVINATENSRGAAKEGVVYGKWSKLENGALAFKYNQQRSNTVTTFTEWTTSSTTESVLKTELIPFMRKIDINFNASGLRPFTRVYPWFSNKMVAAFCKPVSGAYGAPLITDAQGSVTGVFSVPNNSVDKFQTGTSSFVLCDNATNVSDPNLRTTFANVSFESGGKAVTKQRTTVQTRVLGVTSRTEIEYRKVDPVAQSFSVDQQGGLFLEKIEIFFAKKAKSIPVTLEIREMENGLPTHDVVGRVTLNPSSVFTSINADIPTAFNFAPALYLKEGGEYAMVVLANTQEYEVYISELGEKVINSTQTVSAQPHTGVFFTSSNGSTWSPQQLQDLKFKLYRSSFSASPQVVTFKPNMNTQGRYLGSNPVSTQAGSNVLELKIPFHGTQAGDTLVLSGVAASAGIPSSELNRAHQVSEVVSFDTVKIIVTTQSTTTTDFGGSSVFALARNLINLVNINIDHSIFENTSCKFEFRYRLANGRALSPWYEFIPNSDVLVAEEGSFYDVNDIEIRATITASEWLSPQIDLHGFTCVINAFHLSETEGFMNYVSRDIYLDNPSTSSKFFVTSMLPSGSSLKVYVKTITDVESDWVELSPTTPLLNGASTFSENEFVQSDTDEFIGLRVKLSLTGSRVNPPVLKDIRGIILA